MLQETLPGSSPPPGWEQLPQGREGRRVSTPREELEVPQEWVWCCCRGWAAGARDGCTAAWSLGRWSLSRAESGSVSLRLVSHILRIPKHLQTPWGTTTFTDTHWKARQTVRYMQGAAGAQLWGSAMPVFTNVPQIWLLGLEWAKGSYKRMRHCLHNQPALWRISPP